MATVTIITPTYREIQLVNGGVTIVDEQDYEMFSFLPWMKLTGRRASTSYAWLSFKLYGKTINVWLHRLIVDPLIDQYVDHADGNGLDNRRSNLRICSPSQNSCNKKRREDNTSGVSGVSWHIRDKKWYVSVTFGRSRVHIGSFLDYRLAVAARNEAVVRMQGEFGRLISVSSSDNNYA